MIERSNGPEFYGKFVVTGGANGTGLASARALAKGGAQVWIFDPACEDSCGVAAKFGARFARRAANAGIVLAADLAATSREIRIA